MKDSVDGGAMEGQWLQGERCKKLKVVTEREVVMD